MFWIKRHRVRSYDGPAVPRRRVPGPSRRGTHWFLDPLGRVAVEAVSRRTPLFAHAKLDLIVKTGELKGSRWSST
ncbi:MAG: hypothetical protein WKF75_07285 [Singulisphaera sp.]